MVLDTVKIRFLRQIQSALSPSSRRSTDLAVLETEVRNSSHWCGRALRQVLIHRVNAIRDVLVSLVEQVASFFLDRIKSILGRLDSLSSLFKFCVNLLETVL